MSETKQWTDEQISEEVKKQELGASDEDAVFGILFAVRDATQQQIAELEKRIDELEVELAQYEGEL